MKWRKSREAVELLQSLDRVGRQRVVVPLRDLEQRRRAHGAFEVHVQLDLRVRRVTRPRLQSASWARRPTGCARSAARCSATGSPSASAAARAGAGSSSSRRGAGRVPAVRRRAAAPLQGVRRAVLVDRRRRLRGVRRAAAPGRALRLADPPRQEARARRGRSRRGSPGTTGPFRICEKRITVTSRPPRPRGCRAGSGSAPSRRCGGSPGCRARSRAATARRGVFTSTLSITASKTRSRGAEAHAAEHLHDHALLVLARLVAEADRRRLAAASQLVRDHR